MVLFDAYELKLSGSPFDSWTTLPIKLVIANSLICASAISTVGFVGV